MDDLKKLRDRIDELDTQIASLLNERMKATDEIGKFKKDNNKNVTDPSREKIVLEHVEMQIKHPILKTHIAHIYREIMDESKIAQQYYKFSSLPFRRIGIIGLGLMGGSICKGLKIKDHSLEIGSVNYDSDDDLHAKEGHWIDKEYTILKELIENCDLIILAAPISAIIPLAEMIKENIGNERKLLVMDIASVKESIVEAFENLSDEHVEYIGTHPMTGKETTGFDQSEATLFVNKPWIIVPHKKNNEESLKKIEELIKFLGAEPTYLKAKAHDEQAAVISHLPAIIAKSFLEFVSSRMPESLKIAGPGFQSFTRIAHSNTKMRNEIRKYNHKFIQQYFDLWLEECINSNKADF